MSEKRISLDSQFSFESNRPVPMAQGSLNINRISLQEISSLGFEDGVSDTIKLSFIKSLLIKLNLVVSTGGHVSDTYKQLVKDLDDDLNGKLNTMFVMKEKDLSKVESGKEKVFSDKPTDSVTKNVEKPLKSGKTQKSSKNVTKPVVDSEVNEKKHFPTLDPKLSMSPNFAASSTALSGASKSDSSIESSRTGSRHPTHHHMSPSVSLPQQKQKSTSPFASSNPSSDYIDEALQPSTSNVSSNYTSRSNSPNQASQRSRSQNSSIYSPKVSDSKPPTSPSTAYSNNRIQLPSPRFESSSHDDRPHPFKSQIMSPIVLHDSEDLEGKEVNPFTDKSEIQDQRLNKSSSSLVKPDLEKEVEKERSRRNPNRTKNEHKATSSSSKNSPYIGSTSSSNTANGNGKASNSATPKMYGMGIMGLDSPAIVRRDMSPAASPGSSTRSSPHEIEGNSVSSFRKASGGPQQERIGLTNITNPRERFYQSVKSKGTYSTYTNLANNEKRSVKSPQLSGVSTMSAAVKDSRISRSQPSTPSVSTFDGLDSGAETENDNSLFIQPKELNTIVLRLVTSLSINKTNSSSVDPTIVFAAVDRKSQKEIWRFKKSFSQCITFDSQLRLLFDSVALAPFPEKALFLNNMPAKIDSRRSGILDYFITVFQTQLPKKAVYLVCKFISTNTVNPLDDIEYNFSNDINEKDFKKSGFLVRRNKGLGVNWRVRYCKCEGPDFLVYDDLEGNLIESIRLTGAQIGRQNDATSDESSSNAKGYKHAFLLKESKKNSLGSGINKHYFCAETDEERDSWINVLIEHVQDTGAYDNEPVELQNNLSNVSGISSSISNSMTVSSKSTPRLANHSRTVSNEIQPSHHFASGIETSSPVVTSPKQESWPQEGDEKEHKKSRRRLFGGIRNKLVNSSTASPLEPDDFYMNPVTDLTGETSGMTTSVSQNMLDEVSEISLGLEKVFGNTLEGAIRLSESDYEGLKVPSIVYRCIVYLLQTGAGYQEGIFRLSGSTTMIKQLKEQFDSQFDVDLVNLDIRPEINSVTGLLKLYLRELPSSLLPVDIENRLHSAISEYSSNLVKASPQLSRVQIEGNSNSGAYLTYIYQFKSLLHQIPTLNKNLFYILFKYLNEEVLARSDYNKMNLRNLVIVFSATLNIDTKILCEFFINFAFLFDKGEAVNEEERPNIDMGSIPLM